MNLLLDTHIALWAIVDSPRLTEKARDLIASPKATVWISAVTIWEIAIKHSLGRGDMPISGQQSLQYFQKAGYLFLPVQADHAAAVESLPLHHQDPFDRMIIAQALLEPLRLITNDAKVALYSDTIIEI